MYKNQPDPGAMLNVIRESYDPKESSLRLKSSMFAPLKFVNEITLKFNESAAFTTSVFAKSTVFQVFFARERWFGGDGIPELQKD